MWGGFLGGTVVKNPPVNVEARGRVQFLGRKILEETLVVTQSSILHGKSKDKRKEAPANHGVAETVK